MSRLLMKLVLTLLTLITFNSVAECAWSKTYPILNYKKLTFQECKKERKIRINGIEVEPSIDFEIVDANYPEGNTLWDEMSPDNKTALVWVENNKYERELWVIDLVNNSVELSISSLAEGRHFLVHFISNERFVVTIGGMGYKKETFYQKASGTWNKVT